MKLKTKLIPLTAILTSAAITPVIAMSSCAKSTKIEMHDVTNGYTFGLDKSTAGMQNREQISNDYYNKIKNDRGLFVEDYLSGWSKNLLAYYLPTLGSNLELVKLELGVSYPKIGETLVLSYGNAGVTYPTLSFSTKMRVLIKDKESGMETKEEITVNYSNVVFSTHEANDSTISPWNVGIFNSITGNIDTDLAPLGHSAEPWSIKVDYNVQQIERKDDGKAFIVSIKEDSLTFKSLIDISSWMIGWQSPFESHVLNMIFFDFSSQYLSNVKVLPELRQKDQLHCEFAVGSSNPINIFGLELSNYDESDISDVEVALQQDVKFHNASITYGDHNITLHKGVKLQLDYDPTTGAYGYCFLGTIDHPFESIRTSALAFSLENKTFDVEISYTIDGQRHSYTQTINIYHNHMIAHGVEI